METWGSPETLSVSPQEGGEIFILIADSGCYMAETNTALSSNYLLTKTEEKREREREAQNTGRTVAARKGFQGSRPSVWAPFLVGKQNRSTAGAFSNSDDHNAS